MLQKAVIIICVSRTTMYEIMLASQVRSYSIDIVITQHYYHEGSELDIILGVVRTAGSIFIGIAVLLMIIVLIFFFLKLITPILLILTGSILLVIIFCIGLWLLRKFR
jgi:O-antigen/teichoic acid export membrane protein